MMQLLSLRAKTKRAQASRDKGELVAADLNLDEIQEVRNVWQFFRDHWPETYQDIVNPL